MFDAELAGAGIDVVGRQAIGELVGIAEVPFELGETFLELGDDWLGPGIRVEIPHFFGVLLEVIEFPLILAPEVNEFVSGSADSVVGASVVMTGIVVVAIIEGVTPVIRRVT
jgi:hypothetical protein